MTNSTTTRTVVVRPPIGEDLRAARLNRANIRTAKKIEDNRQKIDIIKAVLQDPLIVGLAALAANEIAYRNGLYEPLKGEEQQSELGGPVWFQIGKGLPPAQAKRNFINTMIVGVTTARAMAPAMNSVLSSGLTVGKALAAASA